MVTRADTIPAVAPLETLRISHHARDQIERHALDSFPNECVGFLVAGRSGLIEDVVRLSNSVPAAADSSFQVSDVEFRMGLAAIADQGAELAGLYHSHPLGHGELSQLDRERLPVDLVHLVVGVFDQLIVDLKAWFLTSDHQVVSVPYEFAKPPPTGDRRR